MNKLRLPLFLVFVFVLQLNIVSTVAAQLTSKKILVVVTSNNRLKDGQSAGFYLPELLDFYTVLKERGLGLDNFDVVSPKGGKAPMYQRQNYLSYYDGFPELSSIVAKTDNSLNPKDIDPIQYSAVYYVGGFAALYDLAKDTAIATIAKTVYDRGGVLSGVCHGQSGLLPIKNANGTPFLSGKRVTTRSWEEESNQDEITRAQILTSFPFILAEKFTEAGATVEHGPYMEAYIVTDGHIVTGQNEYSGNAVTNKLLDLLETMSVNAYAGSTIDVTIKRTEQGLTFTMFPDAYYTVKLTDLLGREFSAKGNEVIYHNLSRGKYLARISNGKETATLKIHY